MNVANPRSDRKEKNNRKKGREKTEIKVYTVDGTRQPANDSDNEVVVGKTRRVVQGGGNNVRTGEGS